MTNSRQSTNHAAAAKPPVFTIRGGVLTDTEAVALSVVLAAVTEAPAEFYPQSPDSQSQRLHDGKRRWGSAARQQSRPAGSAYAFSVPYRWGRRP